MFKTAIIQFAPVLGEIQHNTDLIHGFIEDLGDFDLVVLPELASTGYNFTDPEMAAGLAEEIASSQFVEMLVAMAKANNQYIVSGFSEKADDGIYNSSLLTGPHGLEGTYRKMHLFMKERYFFRPGNSGLNVYDTGFCLLGMQICFDYLFPEPWRILAQKKAEVIIHPSNLLTQNAMKALPGIALMNKVFIVTANRIGTEGDLTFNGSSMILNPNGDLQEQATSDKTEVLTGQIDPRLAQNKMITSMNHVFNDRRPEQYDGDSC